MLHIAEVRQDSGRLNPLYSVISTELSLIKHRHKVTQIYVILFNIF